MVDLLASAVEFEEQQPRVVQITPAPSSIVGALGVTERGPVFSEQVLTSYDDYERIFGDFTSNTLAALSVKGFFENGGTEMHFVRVVHCTNPLDPTTQTATQASLVLDTAVETATSGSETSTNTAPFALAPGETLVIAIDGGGTQTFTFTATSGSVTASGSAPYALANNETLQLAIDGGSTQTITFLSSEFASIGAATVAEVVAVLNAYFAANGIGAVADNNAGEVRITSNRKGTGSNVNIIGGTGNGALGFGTGSHAGTGNVSNILAVTSAEVLADVTPTGATVTAVGGAIKITSNTTGSTSKVQVTNASTAAAEFGFDNAIHSGGNSGAEATLEVLGKTPGTYADAITVQVTAPTDGNAAHFNLIVVNNGIVAERWPNLAMESSDPQYALTIVNDPNTGSNLIALVDEFASFPSPLNLPTAGTFGPLTGGGDGLASLNDNDFIGGTGVNGDVGLNCLDIVQDLSILIVPGRATPAVHNAMITYCEITRAGFVFAILDPPLNQSTTEIVTYVTETAALEQLSEYAAIYWPNILVDNPDQTAFGNAQTLVAAPSGHVAGVYCRTDTSQPAGVFQHPAGTITGKLLNVRGVEMPEVKKIGNRKIVFPELINPLSTEPGQPFFIDGARCLRSNGNFPTVGQRRGVIFIEASLQQSLAPVRHANLTDSLLKQCARSTDEFLLLETQNNAFASTDPSLAYSIDFGDGLNTPQTRKLRELNGAIGLATADPAEFVIIQVSKDTRALDAALAAAATAS